MFSNRKVAGNDSNNLVTLQIKTVTSQIPFCIVENGIWAEVTDLTLV